MHSLKKFLVICNIFSIILFSGCSSNQDRSLSSIMSTAGDTNRKVLEYIEHHDEENLKILLSPKLLEKNDKVDEEITDALNAFSGSIVSRNKTSYGEEGSKTDGVYTQYFVYALNYSIKTDTDKEYDVICSLVVVYDPDPDRVGVAEIVIRDDEGNSFQIGDFYSVNPELKH
jgi:hypothetical protein